VFAGKVAASWGSDVARDLVALLNLTGEQKELLNRGGDARWRKVAMEPATGAGIQAEDARFQTDLRIFRCLSAGKLPPMVTASMVVHARAREARPRRHVAASASARSPGEPDLDEPPLGRLARFLRLLGRSR
jgi:hypothetical protein